MSERDEGLSVYGRRCLDCDERTDATECCGEPTEDWVACPRPDCDDKGFWRSADPCLAFAVDSLLAAARREAALREEVEDWKRHAKALSSLVPKVTALEEERDRLAAERLILLRGILAAGEAFHESDEQEAYHQLYSVLRDVGFDDLPGGTFHALRARLAALDQEEG